MTLDASRVCLGFFIPEEPYFIQLPVWKKNKIKNSHPSAFLIKLLGEERGGELARLAADV